MQTELDTTIVKQAKAPWYSRAGSLVFSFFLVGPFMLPLLWLNPELSQKKKVSWTAIILLASAVLLWITLKSLNSILEYYTQLDRLELELLP